MGNQSSKDKKSDGSEKSPADGNVGNNNGNSNTTNLAAYPSLSKSDTKESSRSFRGSIRSKIPGSGKTDSPRTSLSDIPRGSASDLTRNSSADSNNTNTPSIVTSPADEEPNHELDGNKHKTRSNSEPTANSHTAPRPSVDGGDSPQPPPSPTMSASVGQGHSSIDRAQRSGEVGTVSDAPPSGAIHSSHNQRAGESILIKSNFLPPPPPKPRSRSKSKDRKKSESVDGNMDMGTLKDEDLDEMIQRLLDAGYAGKVTKTVCLKNAEIEAVCRAARELFLSQPSLLELSPPVKIVGDVHGQYTDLLRMFEMCGFPPNANYLFLGDYVDRGKQSLETILLLLCYKLKFPENFFLLRGNHESANVTRVYGFYDECKRRTTIKIWKTFVDVFNALPIASIVANKIFCVHGGLSPALSHMDDIRQIARPTDVPDYGLLNDLLWSDPAEMDADWEANERGVSYCFGKKVIMEFLAKHDFDLVCRAHMVVEDGYEFFTDRILVTVFSAPNYCGEFDNWGAVMAVSGELLCSFELLKPLDSSALKSHIKKGRKERMNMLNSPPASQYPQSY